jgi:hypothetical protein
VLKEASTVHAAILPDRRLMAKKKPMDLLMRSSAAARIADGGGGIAVTEPLVCGECLIGTTVALLKQVFFPWRGRDQQTR